MGRSGVCFSIMPQTVVFMEAEDTDYYKKLYLFVEILVSSFPRFRERSVPQGPHTNRLVMDRA